MTAEQRLLHLAYRVRGRRVDQLDPALAEILIRPWWELVCGGRDVGYGFGASRLMIVAA
jgi:hypothetical protein